MTKSFRPSRTALRSIAIVGVVAAVIGASAFGISTSMAAQPHMTAALNDLQSTLTQLEDAVPDKAGHRVQAINLVKEAILQTTEGLAAGAI